MKNLSLNRYSPLPINDYKRLRNRVVVPPMASEKADQRGFATERTFEHYELLGESKAGLILVEYSFVHKFGRSEPNQLGISDDEHIPGLEKLATIIKNSGALSGIQLTHAGGKTEKDYSYGAMLSPSGVVVPVKDKILEKPKELDTTEIVEWKAHFINAAIRAQKAGFDLIEIHSAHGYGMNQWLSPFTNKRSDRYGGTIQKNLTLLREIIQEIKIICPRLLISVRIPGQDFIEGGLTPQDSIFIAKDLEKAGVHIINVSSGIGGWKRPRDRSGEGYLVEEAALIAAEVLIPVIGVGGIETGEYIDQIVSEGKIALAAVGRAILKDPKKWAKDQLALNFISTSREIS